MSLTDYLAKNYLTKDSSLKPEKKKKRKHKGDRGGASSGGIIIADDDIPGWDDTHKNSDADNDDGPILDRTYATSDFRKSKKQNWIIANPAPEDQETKVPSERTSEESQYPNTTNSPPEQLMSNGSKAGLQTAEQVMASLAAKRESELSSLTPPTAATDTIYRDASGRIINIALARSEARKKAAEEESKRLAQLEKSKGDVQRLETQRKKQELADAKFMTVARYKDDEEMNEELKQKELWNDPATAFLTKKKAGRTSATGKPVYQGSYPPNRYGIRPGYRWDGVDRSNGFEKKWFAARNRKKEVKELEYAWELDE